MLDVIIGRHTWNCQIRKHIHTGYTHTRTHTQQKKSRKTRFKKSIGKIQKKRDAGSGKKERRKKERTKRKGGKRRRKMRKKGGERKKKEGKKRKREGGGFRGVEERGY